MSDEEHWLPVVGYEGRYEISDLGNVWSCLSNKLLAQTSTRQGRMQVTLLPNTGKRNKKTVSVHRLVLEAFIGPCPEGMECCHWNDDPADNRLENLRWDTRSANAKDKIRNGHNANLNKTYCPHWHKYDEKNTYYDSNGGRNCRACRRNLMGAFRQKARDNVMS